MTVKDLLGKEVQINSWIAISFVEGKTAVLRVGRVVGLGRRKFLDQQIATMAVEWYASSGTKIPARPTAIDSQNPKFIVIPSPV